MVRTPRSLTVPHQAEEVEEEVDEVKVERQRAHKGYLLRGVVHLVTFGLDETLYLLGVVGRKPDKNQYAYPRNHHVHEGTAYEVVDDRGQYALSQSIRAMKHKLPMRVRSFLLTYPQSDIIPKVPAVTKKVVAMEAVV